MEEGPRSRRDQSSRIRLTTRISVDYSARVASDLRAYRVLGIATFDAQELVEGEIVGLLQSMVGQPIGLVLVARDCPDPLPLEVAAHPQVVVVLRSPSVGISKARNIGLRWLSRQNVPEDLIIGFPDDDSYLPEHFIDRVAEAMVDHDIILGGYSDSGSANVTDAAPLTLREVFRRANSAGIFCTWETVKAVQGFDERLGVGSGYLEAGEDLDFIVSALVSGCAGLSCPSLRVCHPETTFVRPERAGVHLAIARRYVHRHPTALFVLLKGLFGAAVGATSLDLRTAIVRMGQPGRRVPASLST
jgi:hypothetical protein